MKNDAYEMCFLEDRDLPVREAACKCVNPARHPSVCAEAVLTEVIQRGSDKCCPLNDKSRFLITKLLRAALTVLTEVAFFWWATVME